jgi:N-acetylmuramoyl-L-alanine amidase
MVRSTGGWRGPIVAFILASAVPALAAMPYRVKEGDSLWEVARRHRTTVSELCRLNGLQPERPLQIDCVLKVPGSGSSGAPAVGTHQYIAEPFVNVRKGPSTERPRLALATRGTPCRVIRISGRWVNIRFPNGTVGWIREDLLKGGVSSAPAPARRRGEKGYIAGTVVNVRRGPGIHFQRVAQSRRGTAVRIASTADGWMKVHFGNGTAGWVAQELIKLGTKTGYAYVRSDILNLRTEPTTGCDKVGQLRRGQRLAVYTRKGDWLRVQCSSGQFGWVAAWLVKERPLSGAGSRSSGRRGSVAVGGISGGIRSLIDTALRYRGIRYRFGSASPRRGFDCSGFVSYVLARHGVRVPRCARDQYQRGRYVARSALRAGDLVFFKNTYRRGISHVGFYMGNGRFIHASTSSGVRITSLGHPYYRQRYAGAKRVL